jgi:hypothetical protein
VPLWGASGMRSREVQDPNRDLFLPLGEISY